MHTERIDIVRECDSSCEGSAPAHMSGCNRWYSGKRLYLANSASHSSSDTGGMDPCGRQSVIDRPDRVRRVTPPSTTMPKTDALQPISHQPTAGETLGTRAG
eukprot:6027898-Pleurochrysis_carterae.AAC.7